jgi:hypothetical protein
MIGTGSLVRVLCLKGPLCRFGEEGEEREMSEY